MIKIDTIMLIYGIEIFFCYATFILFLWWSIYKIVAERRLPVTERKTGVTDIYLFVAALVLTQGYSMSLAFYIRSLNVASKDYTAFLSTPWWEYRRFPAMLVEGYILVVISKRIYHNFFKRR